jgi:pimeloyl-ACP methyl ester carboxylesterase
MLFVHGFPEFWFSWRHQLKFFAKDYWVVAVDLRGYGDSDKPSNTSAYAIDILQRDIYEFIQALKRDKCILVGHDWGGGVCWVVAAKYPELIEKLIILNCPHPSAMITKLQSSVKQFLKSWYMFAFQVPFFPEKYFQTDDLEILRDMYENRISDEDLEALKYVWSKKGAFTPPLNYYRCALSPHSLLHPVKLPKITCPTIIIWGENDLALEKDLPELCRPYVENISIKYIPDANHFVQQDRPDEVNQYMKTFLDKE